MECENNSDDPITREVVDQYHNLRNIVDELRISNYSNEVGSLVCDPAFVKLTELAQAEAATQDGIAVKEYVYEEPQRAEEPFHIEADIYDSGDYGNLLVVPASGNYIVISNNEHLATLSKSCEEPDCWEQIDGTLDEELVDKVGMEITNYLNSF